MISKRPIKSLAGIASFLFLVFSSFVSSGQEVLDRLIYTKTYDQALAFCDSMLEQKTSAEILYKKGIVLREKLEYPASLQAMQEAVIADSTQITYLTDLADLLSTMGDGIKAISIYKKAVALSPDNLPLKARLGRNLLAQQEFREAYRIFKEIRQSDSVNVWFTKNLAMAAFRLEKNREAKQLFQSVLEQYPGEYSSYFNLATLFQQDTAFKRAGEVLFKGLGQFPGNAGLQQKIAQNFYYLNDYENAVKYYELFLAQSDTSFYSRKEYGVVLYHNKQEDKALKILEPALFQAPTDPIIPFYVGLSHKNLKHFKEAQTYLELSEKLAIPIYMTSIHRSLAQVHGLMREFPQAIESYRKVLEFDPEDHEAWFEMATTYEEFESDKTVAYQHYRKYLEAAGQGAVNEAYAKTRMAKIKEDLFFKTGKTEILPLK